MATYYFSHRQRRRANIFNYIIKPILVILCLGAILATVSIFNTPTKQPAPEKEGFERFVTEDCVEKYGKFACGKE